MDTTGFSQVGRYGTLSLLKRLNPGAATTGSSTQLKEGVDPGQVKVITSFGIDSANLTFGSVTTCDVRLYYSEVDPIHCRLVNEDGKAFLVVQGTTGALVDGCWVYPHTSSSTSEPDAPQQTITPLMNNSEFEIHSKRFRFTYPPKDVRKILFATPVANRNRTLRLSMIQSAQVFSPRPSKDPRENLKVLQSPLKTSVFHAAHTENRTRDRSTSPSKPRAVSPLKFGLRPDDSDSDEDLEGHDENRDTNDVDAEEHIILAHTNHPRVVEEDQDLVILEDIPLHLVLPSPSVYSTGSPVRQHGIMDSARTPTPIVVQPQTLAQPQQPQTLAQPQQLQPQPQPQPPRTPRRRSLGGNALHRAVLIRSAQRAVWKAEREKEDEEEEMEVLGAVVAPGDADEHDDEDMDGEDEEEHEQEDVEMRSVSDSDEEQSTDSDEQAQESRDDDKGERKPLWKKSLERIIPWPFGAKKDGKEEEEEEEEEDANVEQHEEDVELDEEEANEKVGSLPVLPKETPIRRALGSFMTPQANQPAQVRKSIFPSTAAATAPLNPEASSSSTTNAGPGRYSLGGGEARRVVVQQPWRVQDLVVPPIGGTQALPPVPRAMDPPSTPAAAPRPSISEEERKAIQERRRSAVREVREDSFWKDGAPGMSPAKKPPPSLGIGLGRPMSSPRKPLLSPTKGHSLGFSIAEAEGEDGDFEMSQSAKPAGATEENESTVDLLERMRETVEDMKRRRNLATLSTPRTTLLDGDNTGMRGSVIRGSVKKLDFSHLTPAQPKRRPEEIKPADSLEVALGTAKVDTEEAPELDEPKPFSLLRPGSRPSLSPKKMEGTSTMRGLPIVTVDTMDAEEPEDDSSKTRGRSRGRSRLLRAPKEVHDVVESDHNEEKESEDSSQSKPKSTTKPTSRSKPPSTTKPRSRVAKSPVPPTIPEDSLAPEPSGAGIRRQRSRTPQPRQPPEESEPEPESEKAPTRSLPKRTRKGTAELEEAPVVPKKKGKKVIAEPEPEPEVEVEEEVVEKVKPTPAKRSRKPRAAATPATVEEEEEEEEHPVPPPAKKGRAKKVKEPVPAPAAEDEDDFDSYEVSQPPANLKKASKLPGRSQKRATEVATPEPPVEAEEEESIPLATTRAGRAPRANANTATKTKTPTNTTTTTTTGKANGGGAKPRGRVKTPATAPAAVTTSATADDMAEKENTRAGSGSANGSDDEPAVTKVRVSRKAGGATAAAAAAGSGKAARTTTSKTKAKTTVKVEQSDDEEKEVVGGGRARTTRVMRTRTKTG